MHMYRQCFLQVNANCKMTAQPDDNAATTPHSPHTDAAEKKVGPKWLMPHISLTIIPINRRSMCRQQHRLGKTKERTP